MINMGELTIVTLCQALANLTHNRCNLVANSNTCRCIGYVINPIPSTIVNEGRDIMLSEVFLIFFVLAIWLSAIGFCLNQYKSLRRLETQVHYCVNRKDPLNIGEIKIVKREQDSIIYKKKRYSTLIDTHIAHKELKAMHYVQQYLPKTTMKTIPSVLSTLVISRDDLTANVPLSTASSTNIPLSTQREITENQSISYCRVNMDSEKRHGRVAYIRRTGSVRMATGLAVPHMFTPTNVFSAWNDSHLYETSCSTQHLCVPSNSLRSNRFSDGNISLPVPRINQINSQTSGERLIDPRLIPEAVRRSLLALHRESQENINMQKNKENTQSENDVHGSFTPWKIKMKSKLKRTHHQQQQSNTLSILPIRQHSNEYDRRVLEYATIHNEYRYSTPPLRHISSSITPTSRRSLKYCPKYSTQSTSESETTQGELPMITSIYVSAEDDDPAKTVIETNEKSLLTSA